MTKKSEKFDMKLFLSLLRALFPSWNFFDRIAYNFEVSFKVPDAQNWHSIPFEQKRTGGSLVLNPAGNLSLAQVNIIEHFAADIQNLQRPDFLLDSKDVQSLTTFKMLKSLLKIKLEDFDVDRGMIQFKVVAVSPEGRIDLYISDWLNMGTS